MIGVIFDLKDLQLWPRCREVFQQAFEAEEGRDNRQSLEAKHVVERSGKEGFYMIIIFEVLIDVEELVPRSAEETFRLLRVGRHGEVDLGPKAGGGE